MTQPFLIANKFKKNGEHYIFFSFSSIRHYFKIADLVDYGHIFVLYTLCNPSSAPWFRHIFSIIRIMYFVINVLVLFFFFFF